MKKSLHIFAEGILERKENTLYFVNKNRNEPLAIENIYQIYCHKPITLTSGVINFFYKREIAVHFFSYYGYYEGSFFPKSNLVSGSLLIKQVENYLDTEKRLLLARKFVDGAISNMIKNISDYNLDEQITEIEELKNELLFLDSIWEIMNIEGRARASYYSCFSKIIDKSFLFERRTKQPPIDEVNALISFGNSLLYTTILNEIYKTQLNPTISYLHEPLERRFSLALDISEIFKPIIVDRLIFYLLNKKIIIKEDFEREANAVFLSEEGRKKFVQYYEKKLQSTIKHRMLKKNVSYKKLIRLECYKIIKHLLGISEYKPFVIWW